MIVIVTASPWELNAILREVPMAPYLVPACYRTAAFHTPAVLVCTGFGPEAAERGLDALERNVRRTSGSWSVDLVASCGFSGALQQDLRTGDLVADVRGLELERVELLRQAARDRGLGLAMGAAAGSDHWLGPQEKRAPAFPGPDQEYGRLSASGAPGAASSASGRLSASGAPGAASSASGRFAVVDMETGGVRRWASLRKTPFLALRTVLDEIDDRLPPVPHGPGIWPAVRYAFENPGQAPAVCATWLKVRRASAPLGRGVRALLESWVVGVPS